MNGLLIGGIIGEGLKSFVSSYNAAKDQQRQQAESDDARALRRRKMKLEEANAGVDYDPETDSYKPREGFTSKRELELYDKDLSDLRAQYGLLTEDQKQGTEEGRGLLNQIGELQKKVSAMRRGGGTGLIAPAPAQPTQNSLITAPPEQVGAMPVAQAPMQNTVAPVTPQAAATAKPKGLLGGMTPIPGYKSKSERETEKAVATERAKQLALGTGSTEMRKEFIGQQAVKDMQNVSTAYAKVSKAAQNPSAAGDLSLIFGYMKMLDPGSTVREGEFANAQNAAGIPDQVLNAYNRARKGERLNPAQREDFVNQAAGIYEAQLGQFQELKNSYDQIARKQGFDPAAVTGVYNFKAPQKKENRKDGGTGGASTKPPQGMVTISNGKETLFVSPADAKQAEKEGFRVIR